MFGAPPGAERGKIPPPGSLFICLYGQRRGGAALQTNKSTARGGYPSSFPRSAPGGAPKIAPTAAEPTAVASSTQARLHVNKNTNGRTYDSPAPRLGGALKITPIGRRRRPYNRNTPPPGLHPSIGLTRPSGASFKPARGTKKSALRGTKKSALRGTQSVRTLRHPLHLSIGNLSSPTSKQHRLPKKPKTLGIAQGTSPHHDSALLPNRRSHKPCGQHPGQQQ